MVDDQHGIPQQQDLEQELAAASGEEISMQVSTGQVPGRGLDTLVLLTDEDQAPSKEIGVENSEGERSFVLKSTQQPGVFSHNGLEKDRCVHQRPRLHIGSLA